MKKRILTLFLVGTMLIMSLTACGKEAETTSNDTGDSTSTVTQTTEQTPTTTETSDTTESANSSATETTGESTESTTTTVHEHKYSETITTEATCNEKGVKTFSCECGESYTEEIAMKEHVSVLAKNAIAETCTTDGKSADTICEVCGVVISAGKTISATGHDYGSYAYNNDATCDNDGTETATCNNCGDKQSQTKSGTKTGHSMSSSITQNATCTTAGVKTYSCSNCGYSYTESIPATGEHTWGEWSYHEPECTHEGYDSRNCSSCGKQENNIHPGTQISHKLGVNVDPVTLICKDCGEYFGE